MITQQFERIFKQIMGISIGLFQKLRISDVQGVLKFQKDWESKECMENIQGNQRVYNFFWKIQRVIS